MRRNTYFRFFGMIHLEDEKIKKRLRAQLLELLDILPVYGFNSSYDINVIKKYLADETYQETWKCINSFNSFVQTM